MKQAMLLLDRSINMTLWVVINNPYTVAATAMFLTAVIVYVKTRKVRA